MQVFLLQNNKPSLYYSATVALVYDYTVFNAFATNVQWAERKGEVKSTDWYVTMPCQKLCKPQHISL